MVLKEIEDRLLHHFPHEPTEGQRIVMLALADFLCTGTQNEVFMLKGYAGTGKTTIIGALVRALPELGMEPVLLAPTGRAAKVMAGYSGHIALTIHKKLYQPKIQPDGRIIFYRVANRHKNALFIVDEASMMQGDSEGNRMFSDQDVLTDFLEYVRTGRNCRLILIGDTAQLPPVGLPVSPAMDPAYLRERYHLKVRELELKEVMRQALDSGILFNATAIRTRIAQNNPSLPLFHISDFPDIQRIQAWQVEEILMDAYDQWKRLEAVIITFSNRRANLFNREIRRRILHYEEELTAGDLLMVVKNNYFWLNSESSAGFIANGDLLEVLSIKKFVELYDFRFARAVVRMVDYPGQPELEVNLLLDVLMSEQAALSEEDNLRLFHEVMKDYHNIRSTRARMSQARKNPWLNALQVKYAYALTCHKTQGGQWETVLIDAPWLKTGKPDVEMLRWLYTALTRSIRKAFLVNFTDEYFHSTD